MSESTRPLGDGQTMIWMHLEDNPDLDRINLNICCPVSVPRTVDNSEIVGALRSIVADFDTLRVQVLTDSEGTTVQRIATPAEVTVPLAALSRTDYSLEEAIQQSLDRTFPLAQPVRLAAAIWDDPDDPDKTVLLVFSHLAVDGISSWMIANTFRSRAISASEKPIDYQQPIGAQVVSGHFGEIERSHWVNHLARTPARTFPLARSSTRDGAVLITTLRSPELRTAAATVAIRQRSSPSVVFHSAFVGSIAASTGLESIATRVWSSNRENRLNRDVVACLAQPTLTTQPVGSATSFSDWLSDARAAHLELRKLGSYPYDHAVECLVLSGSQRGIDIRQPPSFNFIGLPTDDVPLFPMRGRISQTTRSETGAEMDCYFTVYWGPNVATIKLISAESIFTHDEAARLLGAVETMIVSLAGGADTTLSDVEAFIGKAHPDAADGWKIVDNCWVSIDVTSDALLQEGVADPSVWVVGNELWASGELPAGLDIDTLRRSILDKTPSCPGLMAPHRFSADGYAGDPRRVPGDTDGDISVLRDLVREATGRLPDPQRSYIDNGGRLRSLPGIMAKLYGHGIVPPRFYEFASVRSLDCLARQHEPEPPQTTSR